MSMVVATMLLFHYTSAQQSPKTARTDTMRTDFIEIIKSQYGEFLQTEQQSVHKLVGNVKLLHGSDTLYCDSAFLYKKNNSVEAFGNVEIIQADGTRAFADYMRYTGFNKTVYMKGGVTLESKKDLLWSEQIDYNLATKVGKYYNGGTLQSDLTLLTSEFGTYHVKTRDARFKGDVRVQDPDYTTFSEDLGYNTSSKVVTFYDASTVLNDKSRLNTTRGRYDSQNKIAHFDDRSSIWNESQYIEGDTLDYNGISGLAQVRGNVIALDTVQQITLYSGYTEYNEQSGKMWATIRPLLKIRNNNDSLYVKADTFFSEPIENLLKGLSLTAEDSLQKTLNALRAAAADGALIDSMQLDSLQKLTLPTLPDSSSLADTATILDEQVDSFIADSVSVSLLPNARAAAADSIGDIISSSDTISDTEDTVVAQEYSVNKIYKGSDVDTSKPRYFIGFHHVVIYSDSMQGKCDSFSYSRADSMMRMFYNPVLWSRNGQILGDTILAKVDSSKIDWMYVPRNGIMINQSGPKAAGMFDQLQGNKMWVYFSNNQMDSMVAMPNASSIYYLQDESEAYIGVSEAKSEKIEIHFDTTASGQRIRRVYYRKDVEQTMTPMMDVKPASLKLSRFKWRENERPISLEEFLKNTAAQPSPVILDESTKPVPITSIPERSESRNNADSNAALPVPEFHQLLKAENADTEPDEPVQD
jgi:lipopolysaccharide export system protein LptA